MSKAADTPPSFNSSEKTCDRVLAVGWEKMLYPVEEVRFPGRAGTHFGFKTNGTRVVFQPTTQPTKCDALYDFRELWLSPRLRSDGERVT